MTALPKVPGVIEGQTLKGDLEVSVDVCIIGSGPGGASAALAFAAAGKRVLVVEEGGYFTKTRFRMREDEAYTNLYQDGGQRTTKDLAISIYQGKAVGGGSVINWTTCFRLPEHVLEHWAHKHQARGFTHNDIVPHYERIEKRLSITKVDEASVNPNNRLLLDGCRALDLEVDTINRNVLGCAQTGACGLGCPIDAKQSMLVSLLPDAMDRGATVLSRCRVDRLHFKGDKVSHLSGVLLGATGREPTGATIEVKADRFILSAGAIGSPGILLRSKAPDPSGMTGRRSFLHPVSICAGLFPEPVHGYHGAPQSVASHHFAERGGKDVGFFLEAAPVSPGLVSTAVPGYGKAHRAVMKMLPFVGGHIAITIDGFHDDVPGGTVELDPRGRPLLNYTAAPRTLAAMRAGHKTLAKLQLEMGAKEVHTLHQPLRVVRSQKDIAALDDAPYGPGEVFMASAHQMGGCMMSDDPNKGVVRSEDLRHHAVTNLHILDGSVFPTSLGVNPQETIYGIMGLIAARLAA